MWIDSRTQGKSPLVTNGESNIYGFWGKMCRGHDTAEKNSWVTLYFKSMLNLMPFIKKFCNILFPFVYSLVVELIYYKMEQFLSQSGSRITKWGRFILLQSREASGFTNCGTFHYKLGQVICHKVEPSFLESGAAITK